jgi:hypothetical protein
MVPETKGLKLEEVDNVFRNRSFWGGRKVQVSDGENCDAEKGGTKQVEDIKKVGVKETERIDTSKKDWLNTLPD